MKILNKTEIIKLLPHREPMLLIHELRDIKKLSSATGVVSVKKNSFFVNEKKMADAIWSATIVDKK